MTDPHNPYAPPPPSDERPDFNPYAPPGAAIGSTDFGAAGDLDHAEAIRRELLSHEASIKSLGCLYYWSGMIAAVATVLMLIASVFGAGILDEEIGTGGLVVGIVALYGLLAWLNIWIGKGLRELDAKVRTILSVFLAIGLIGFPFGTLLSGYFLWILHGEKGKRVLTEEYRRIVAATPHMKYRTPLWVWLTVALIGLLVLGALVAAISESGGI